MLAIIYTFCTKNPYLDVLGHRSLENKVATKFADLFENVLEFVIALLIHELGVVYKSKKNTNFPIC